MQSVWSDTFSNRYDVGIKRHLSFSPVYPFRSSVLLLIVNHVKRFVFNSLINRIKIMLACFIGDCGIKTWVSLGVEKRASEVTHFLMCSLNKKVNSIHLPPKIRFSVRVHKYGEDVKIRSNLGVFYMFYLLLFVVVSQNWVLTLVIINSRKHKSIVISGIKEVHITKLNVLYLLSLNSEPVLFFKSDLDDDWKVIVFTWCEHIELILHLIWSDHSRSISELLPLDLVMGCKIESRKI